MASNDMLGQAQRNAKRFLAGFSTGQKAIVLIGLALVVALAVLYSSLTSAPTYGVLFSNLSSQDAGAISAKLQAANVPFQLASGGQTILVPQNLVDQERIDMAQAGLPANSTVGLSLLSTVGITTSQLTQQADYQAALQGQLEQTIEAINGVSSAQVNLALPPTDVFAAGTGQSPSASVIVTLSPGVTLTATQVQAIVHLVASAIPGMAASDVTVADQNGDVLAAPGMSSTGGSSSGATQAFNSQLESSIQSMLDSVLGPNNSNVRVAATLNFNQVTTSTQSIPLGKNGKPITAVTQNQTQTQTYTGTGAVPGGALGAVGAAVGNQTGNYKQTSATTSYAMGQISQTVDQAPGQIQRLSIAVAINSKAKGASVAKIKQLVSAAAGVMASRGDTLSVVALPFATQSAAPVSAFPLSSILGLGKIVLLVAGIAVAILLMSRASASTEIEPLALEEFTPQLALAGAATAELPRALTMPEPSQIVADDVLDYIDKQPGDVAKLLRVWMNSRSRH